MQTELLGVVSRTTRALLESAVLQAPISGSTGSNLWPATGVPALTNGLFSLSPMLNGDARQKRVDGVAVVNSQQSHPLPELLYTLLDQFRRIAEGHGFMLKRISQTCEKYNVKNIRLYEIADVWSMVQAVVRLRSMDMHTSWKYSSKVYFYFIILFFRCNWF